MIQIFFQLEGEHLNHNRWAYEEGYIEGDMQICVNDEIFFDSVVNVVELGIQLGRWAKAIRRGNMIDFAYETINHDEPILNFTIQEEGVQLYSIWQQLEVTELVPLEIVKDAITIYLYALNLNLHKLNYFEKLDRLLDRSYSSNAIALMFFERNDYDTALSLLKKVAEEQRDVQSLNNLAWMYLKEEMDEKSAKSLLEEVLTLNPKSYFPYNMLAEIALEEDNIELAESYLIRSLQIQYSDEATHNLGIVNFHQGRLIEAVSCFSKCANGFKLSKLYEIYTHLKCGQMEKVKEMIASWSLEDEDFVSATQIADLYIEMGDYTLAKKWLAFDWSENGYYNTLYDISRYAYTLMQLGEDSVCQQIIEKAIELKADEINMANEEACTEDWSEVDKQEWLAELHAEKIVLQQLFEQLKQGYVPPFEFELQAMSGCYLFGCKRHGHAEYID